MERIPVKIKPNSKIDEIVSRGKVWRVNVKAKAVNNKANIALVKLLSKELGKKVRIVKGIKSKLKIIEIS